MNKRNITFIFSAIIVFLFVLFVLFSNQTKEHEDNGEAGNEAGEVQITSFDECVDVENSIVLESYPRECRLLSGESFIEYIGNELEKTDLIRVSSPRPNDFIQSPLVISGEARGYWFFEASFPIRIYDDNGEELGVAIASAESDWMTEDFVPFTATLDFIESSTEGGLLILEKDNPSGMAEYDDSLEVPVIFGEEAEKQEVRLYYYDFSKDIDENGNVLCSDKGLVYVEREVSAEGDIIKNTIDLLLEGNLTAEEQVNGITTEFPLEGVRLQSVSISGNELTLYISDPNNKTSGGSCRAGVLWAQIEATAKQFSNINSVKFSPEDLFQP